MAKKKADSMLPPSEDEKAEDVKEDVEKNTGGETEAEEEKTTDLPETKSNNGTKKDSYDWTEPKRTHTIGPKSDIPDEIRIESYQDPHKEVPHHTPELAQKALDMLDAGKIQFIGQYHEKRKKEFKEHLKYHME